MLLGKAPQASGGCVAAKLYYGPPGRAVLTDGKKMGQENAREKDGPQQLGKAGFVPGPIHAHLHSPP